MPSKPPPSTTPLRPTSSALTHWHQRVVRPNHLAYVGQRLHHCVCQVANEGGVGVERGDAAPVPDTALLLLGENAPLGARRQDNSLSQRIDSVQVLDVCSIAGLRVLQL